MSIFKPTGVERTFSVSEIKFPDFDISWAGLAYPWREGFCFGSEDGRIRFAEFNSPEGPAPIVVAESREAINGVAFSGDMMAVSTRAEVVFWHDSDSSLDRCERRTLAAGAHGISVTPRGNFIAPLGTGGLLIKDPASFDHLATMTLHPRGRIYNIYKTVGLPSIDGVDGELVVCAARRDGVAVILSESHGNGGYLNTLRSPGNDVVDICRIASEEAPFAVAAIGKDRSLHLIRNILDVGKPPTLRLPGLTGTAYRILSSGGHLFMLTSHTLYVFPGLASRFLNEESLDGFATAWSVDLHAVDAYLAGSRILVVLSDHVWSMPIDDLASKPASCLDPFNGIYQYPTSVETLPWDNCPTLRLDYASV